MDKPTEKLINELAGQSPITLSSFLGVTLNQVKQMRKFGDLLPAITQKVQDDGLLKTRAWLDSRKPKTTARTPVVFAPDVIQLATDIQALPDPQIAAFFGVAEYQIGYMRKSGTFIQEISGWIVAMGFDVTRNRIGI